MGQIIKSLSVRGIPALSTTSSLLIARDYQSAGEKLAGTFPTTFDYPIVRLGILQATF
jgi:hypothetical protein